MTLREAWVLPFLRAIPWVTAHPTSRRLPRGMRFGHNWRNARRGRTTLQAFCEEWLGLANDYPALITDQDCAAVAPLFDTLDKLDEKS